MNLKTTIIFLLIGFLILNSCSFKKSEVRTVEVKDYPSSTNIQPIQESKTDFLINAYSDLKIINDYLVVIDGKTNYKLKIIEKKSLSFICSKIRKGNGPNEVLDAGLLQVRKDTLMLFDGIRKKIYQYEINELVRSEVPSPYRVTKLHGSANDVKCLSPNKYIFAGEVADGLIAVQDSNGTINRVIGEIPKLYPKGFKNKSFFNLINYYHIALFPDEKSFIVSSMFSSRLQIFSIDGTEKFNIIGPYHEEPIFKASGSDITFDFKNNEYMGYSDVIVKDKYIYTIMPDRTEEDKSKRKGSIIIFKHDGTIVAHLKTDYRISAIDVDEENNIIYALLPDRIQKYKYETSMSK